MNWRRVRVFLQTGDTKPVFPFLVNHIIKERNKHVGEFSIVLDL